MKKIFLIAFFFLVIAVIFLISCKKNEYKNLDCTTISSAFNANIKTILTVNCVSSGCHNASSIHGDFTGYAGAKSKVDNGTMNSRVLLDKTMPESGALSLDDRKKIKCWINGGAPNN